MQRPSMSEDGIGMLYQRDWYVVDNDYFRQNIIEVKAKVAKDELDFS